MIGILGDIAFEVSRSKVNTFDGMKWNSSARYASHSRHLRDPLLEFVGNDNDKISFSMMWSAYPPLSTNPLDEITKLLKAERDGKVMRLVIGTHAYGKNKWVIKSLNVSMKHFDNYGNLLAAAADVSLEAYAAR